MPDVKVNIKNANVNGDTNQNSWGQNITFDEAGITFDEVGYKFDNYDSVEPGDISLKVDLK